MMIHKTAVIDSEAELGRDVSVGPFSYIEKDVCIGDGCIIGPHVTILRHTSIGSKCKIHSGAVLGDVPQDIGFKNDKSFVKIGSNCRIREGVTIHRGTKPETATEIADDCFLMAFSHCAHNVKLGRNVIIANASLLGGYVEVGERTFISSNCLIHQFVKIGRLAMLSGGTGISKDVPPFCTLKPLWVNTVAGLNIVGMRRSGLTPQDRKEIKQAFKLLYHSDLNVSQAIKEIKSCFSSGPALEFCTFVEQSKRGICGFSEETE